MVDNTVRYALFDMAFGTCSIAWSPSGVVRLVLPESSPAETEGRLRRRAGTSEQARPPAAIQSVIRMVQDYFAGEDVDFRTVRVDLPEVAGFDRRIYQALRGIGRGRTTTYGDLARLAGAPGSARAVGRAMAKNPVPVIIPCHRVLASGGKLGGFSAHGGTATKQRMLALEHVTLAL